MTARVVMNARNYWTWPELPERAHVAARLPKPAAAAWDEYDRVVARRDEVRRQLADTDDRSAAMDDARRLDREAALVAMRNHEPAPTPVHRPRLLQTRAALEVERDNLPVLANEALDGLDVALRAAQPQLLTDAYAAMNRTLTDPAASWRTKLDAVAHLAWCAQLPDTTPPHLAEYQTCERAEEILAAEPSAAGRRVIEQMPEALRRRLATEKLNA